MKRKGARVLFSIEGVLNEVERHGCCSGGLDGKSRIATAT